MQSGAIPIEVKIAGGAILLIVLLLTIASFSGKKSRAEAKLVRAEGSATRKIMRQERLTETRSRKLDMRECRKRCKFGLFRLAKKRKCINECLDNKQAA